MTENYKLVYDLMKFGAKPCGSRHVLGDLAPEQSDTDFYILESRVQEFESKFSDFFTKAENLQYCDMTTVGLYTYKPKFYKNEMTIINLDDRSEVIEVTVKKDEYAKVLDFMWSFLKKSPEFFKTKFWKQSGIPKVVIKERIENFIKTFI